MRIGLPPGDVDAARGGASDTADVGLDASLALRMHSNVR